MLQSIFVTMRNSSREQEIFTRFSNSVLITTLVSFYTVSEHYVGDKSKRHLFTLTVSERSKVLLLTSPPSLSPADDILLDKGSLCLKCLCFPWACGRCCIPNKPCTHNLQTGLTRPWKRGERSQTFFFFYLPLLTGSKQNPFSRMLS